MNFKTYSTRAGITLMEVLISIGILAVGLTAVITIIPAAGSQAQKALTETNKANVGLAAMDDAITRGILAPPGAPPFIVDPLGNTAFAGLALEILGGLDQGIAADEVFRSQDDVLYSLENSGQDNPPQPLFYEENASKLKRLSEGVYSWFATLVPQGGENYLLSVVSFHRRDATAPTSLTLTSASGNSVTFSWDEATDGSFRETFPRGSVVLLHDTAGPTWEWRRIIFPSHYDDPTHENDPNDDNDIKNTAQLMFDADVTVAAGTTTVYAFKGAVGVAERLVRLEGTSPWTQ
jgi:type II secretory pathway pseudopilin PulG